MTFDHETSLFGNRPGRQGKGVSYVLTLPTVTAMDRSFCSSVLVFTFSFWVFANFPLFLSWLDHRQLITCISCNEWTVTTGANKDVIWFSHSPVAFLLWFHVPAAGFLRTVFLRAVVSFRLTSSLVMQMKALVYFNYPRSLQLTNSNLMLWEIEL